MIFQSENFYCYVIFCLLYYLAVQQAVLIVQFLVCNMQCIVFFMHCAVCSMLSNVCSVHCAVFSVSSVCAEWRMQFMMSMLGFQYSVSFVKGSVSSKY